MTRDDARRPSELCNASEAAAIVGVTPSAISNYRKRRPTKDRAPFPAAWLEIRRGPRRAPAVLFVRVEVEAWAAAYYARREDSREQRIAELRAELARLESLRHNDATAAGPTPAETKGRA